MKPLAGKVMEPLMYLTAFGSVLVLFLSMIAVLVWMLKIAIRTAHRFSQILSDPAQWSIETFTRSRRPVLDTNHLKRAGQL